MPRVELMAFINEAARLWVVLDTIKLVKLMSNTVNSNLNRLICCFREVVKIRGIANYS